MNDRKTVGYDKINEELLKGLIERSNNGLCKMIKEMDAKTQLAQNFKRAIILQIREKKRTKNMRGAPYSLNLDTSFKNHELLLLV